MRRALERLRERALAEGRVELDPIRVVLDYEEEEDREVVGLLAALLAYGRVAAMRAHTRELLARLGPRPARRLRAGVPRLNGIRYRFHSARDLEALLRGIRGVLRARGSLREAFDLHWRRDENLRGALTGFVDEIRRGTNHSSPGLTFLLADPARGGACKRWLLYLRWMIRSEPGDPDLGVWSRAQRPSILLVPLDTHLVRVSRRLGLTSRRTPDWKMAEEVTASLRRFSAEDPVRYDFPLCHLGIAGSCPPRLAPEHCRRCPLRSVCPTGQGILGGKMGAPLGRGTRPHASGRSASARDRRLEPEQRRH